MGEIDASGETRGGFIDEAAICGLDENFRLFAGKGWHIGAVADHDEVGAAVPVEIGDDRMTRVYHGNITQYLGGDVAESAIRIAEGAELEARFR